MILVDITPTLSLTGALDLSLGRRLTIPYWNDGEEWDNDSFPRASFDAHQSYSGSNSAVCAYLFDCLDLTRSADDAPSSDSP